jgi:hypothetical protein
MLYMKKLFNEYRYVKLVRKTTVMLEKKHKVKLQAKGYSAVHASKLMMQAKYLKWRWYSSVSEANRINRNALKDGYLEPVELISGNYKADGLCVTDKGDDLLDTVFWIIPIGYIEALAKKYPETRSILRSFVAFASSIISAVVASVVTYIIVKK